MKILIFYKNYQKYTNDFIAKPQRGDLTIFIENEFYKALSTIKGCNILISLLYFEINGISYHIFSFLLFEENYSLISIQEPCD